MNERCIFCLQEPAEFSFENDVVSINCLRCGRFQIVVGLSEQIGSSGLADSHIYAGAVREQNERGIEPKIDNLDSLLATVRVPRNPLEMMDRILLSIKSTHQRAGTARNFLPEDYSIAYAHDTVEFSYLISTMSSLGFLRDFGTGLGALIEYAGWERLRELEKSNVNFDQAFVAMRFHDDLQGAWKNGIEPALREANYEPLRIDRKEHNDRIDDLIIAEIRKSGLLVADFTQQSPGVYFEAGFALGLGIPVIWCCKDDEEEKKNLHFDTRQYNHIMWKNPSDLKTQLVNRINATAPRKKVE